MEYRESLARVIDVWKARYPDIPWGPQQIRVPVSIEGDRLHFIALCPGLDSQPKVHFSVFSEKKDDSPRITDGVNFVIRALEDCGGYMISVDQLWTGRVQSIALSQSEHAIRICPIVIMQYLESSSEWIVIYNSHDRTCDLVKEINKILFSVNTPLFENARIFLEEMLNRNFNRAAHYARQLDNEVLTRIFFRWVCDRFQIDFNAHGAKRTFRFWSNTERQNYLNRALDVINVLRSISDDICLGYGAILGHRREGRLLQHDDDLDVLIGIEAAKDVSLGATLDNIAQVLERSGFRICRWINSEQPIDEFFYERLQKSGLEFDEQSMRTIAFHVLAEVVA